MKLSVSTIVAWSILFLGIFVVPLSNAVGSYKYQRQNLQLIKEINTVLVKRGHCEDVERCSTKQILFSSSEPWGIAVSIYGISDDEVLKELSALCVEYFYREKAEFSIKLDIYAKTKGDELRAPFFSKSKPVVNIKMERTNAER